MRSREEVLSDLNADLPKGVDWQAGAITYLTNYFNKHPRRAVEHYALTKPLAEIPPESQEAALSEIVYYTANFVNTIKLLNLPRGSQILDVACGGGWVAHWLARIGYLPVGIDISQEFIQLARRRIREDPYLARDVDLGRPGSDPDEIFFCHNIENTPLDDRRYRGVFHAAILESCLHHFLDPISALSNIANSLREDGLVVILEGQNQNGPIQDPYLSAMLETNTLERPLPRSLLIESLELAGLPHFEFVGVVNGFFSPKSQQGELFSMLTSSAENANLAICAKNAAALDRVGPFRNADSCLAPLQVDKRIKKTFQRWKFWPSFWNS